MPDDGIAANLDTVRRRIRQAADRAGRSPDHVTLVAVSKTFSADHIRAAADAGQATVSLRKTAVRYAVETLPIQNLIKLPNLHPDIMSC